MLPAVAALLFAAGPLDLSKLTPRPKSAAVAAAAGRAELAGPGDWGFLTTDDTYDHVEVTATVTLPPQAGGPGDYFGSGWNVWPRADWGGDRGYDAAVLLRAGDDSGYRVQVSAAYQDLALVKYPAGGYLRAVPCVVKTGEPIRLAASARGDEVIVSVNGKELIRCRDLVEPLTKGRVGVGAGPGRKATFEAVSVRPLEPGPAAAPPAHRPNFRTRTWLGNRPWVFDGDEPVLTPPTKQVHTKTYHTQFVNAKLAPGYRPLLNFNASWDVANQGAYPPGGGFFSDTTFSGGGERLTLRWTQRQHEGRFEVATSLVCGYDPRRGTYTYDVDSELEVKGDKPFRFQYGLDFEHHTPLDPFGWQYLVCKRRDGSLYHRPVGPVDPGPQYDLATSDGLRVWHGRHTDAGCRPCAVSPAVEYRCPPQVIDDPKKPGEKTVRKVNTAVCAAFYDTGVAFEPEEAKPGTRYAVKYRYTGYPAAEAEALFRRSSVYPLLTLDPGHHFIFADEWPRLTFSHASPLSKSWILGRNPFMTAHNTRPTYEAAEGVNGGSAMRLGPASFAKAALPVKPPLEPGRYAVTALVRRENVHGPGGRLELTLTQAKTNKELATHRHYLGAGTADWARQGFAFDAPAGAAGVTLALGNAGTGDVLVTDVLVERSPASDPEPPNATPAKVEPPSPAGALADYRMREQGGLFALDAAGGPCGHLALANLGWAADEGRPAVRFADRAGAAPRYRSPSSVATYLDHPAYADHKRLPVATAGFHGGDIGPLPGVTLAAWVKPDAAMNPGQNGNGGDVVGFGARKFILTLAGQTAPYRLAARVYGEPDLVTSDAKVEGGRWQHVAATYEKAAGGKQRVRLYLDGRPVLDRVTAKADYPAAVQPSVVLGAELFYFHSNYYRGLLGRVLVFGRAAPADEIKALAAER